MRPIKYFLFILLIILFSSSSAYSKTDTPGIPLETNPDSVDCNPDTDVMVVANEESDSVSIVDLNTHEVLATVPVGGAPRGVAIDRELNVAVIGSSHNDIVTVIDLNTYNVVADISVGKAPEGVAVDETTHTALVANHKDSTVSVIDLQTLTNLGDITVGQEPIDIAVDTGLHQAIVVNEKDWGVSIIDLDTYEVTDTVAVGKKPRAIDVNPETHLAVVANEKDNSISLINLTDLTVVDVPIGKHPIDVAINQLDNTVLVISDQDNLLLVADLGTGMVTKSYELNKLTKGVAVNPYTNVIGVVDEKTDSLNVNQLPNPAPVVDSVSPPVLSRGSRDAKVSISGSRFLKTSTVKIQSDINTYSLTPTFIDNHALEVMLTEEILAAADTCGLTVTNPAPSGGTSEAVELVVENPVPQIALIDPMETKTGLPGLTLDVFGDGFFEDTKFYVDGEDRDFNYIKRSKVELGLTAADLEVAGEREITAYNSPPGGGTSEPAILTVKPSVEVTITSPTDGATVNGARVIVRGTFKADNNDVGIRVNGALAEIFGQEWVANDVPLSVGQNTLEAVITDPDGNTANHTITVHTDSTEQAVRLSANTVSGIQPLEVYFSVDTYTPNQITQYQMDFEGDGSADYTGATFEDINHTYAAEGVYFPTVTVTDSEGNAYSDTIAVTVLSREEMDALLRGKWNDMKGALANKDVERALSNFISASHERYQYMFTVLLDSLPEIANGMQDIELVALEADVAEYRIKRVEDVGDVTYYIYFVKDEDGIWKIMQF